MHKTQILLCNYALINIAYMLPACCIL